MCEFGLLSTLLTHCKHILMDITSSLYLPVVRILEKLASQAMDHKDLRCAWVFFNILKVSVNRSAIIESLDTVHVRFYTLYNCVLYIRQFLCLGDPLMCSGNNQPSVSCEEAPCPRTLQSFRNFFFFLFQNHHFDHLNMQVDSMYYVNVWYVLLSNTQTRTKKLKTLKINLLKRQWKEVLAYWKHLRAVGQ